MPTKNPDSSIPELIKRIRHSFRQCEFDEVRNTLMDGEKRMKDEIQNLVRQRDSLKNELDSLQRTQGFTELEKCSAEEKLGRSERRCGELDELIFQMREKIEKLMNEKMDLEAKVTEADGVVNELNRKNLEAVQTINELRAKMIESDEVAEIYERNLSRVGRTLAEIKNVHVDDLGSLANRTDEIAAAATDTKVEENANHSIMSPEVPANSGTGAGNLAHLGTKLNDANTVCTSKSASSSAVAESNATAHDNDGLELRCWHASVMETATSSSAAGNVVITLSDSDDDDENKRKSAINRNRKRKRNTCTTTTTAAAPAPAVHNVEYVDLEDRALSSAAEAATDMEAQLHSKTKKTKNQ